MNEQHMDSITNCYSHEYNYCDEQDYAFDRKLREEDEEKLSIGIEKLYHFIGE